ncbi:hypothetical protein MNBD_ALPHA12-671 [hydrothermal vent metagenome]|uniref:HPt domain-containing protein n=1 Tax=hydrothermal vent metagenome TaxID=652676 RepID=A0A3B0U2C4_9ZZZZ
MVMLAKVSSSEAMHPVHNEQRPIDLVHLAKQSLGDPGLEEEILRMFDQVVQTYVRRVSKNIACEEVLADLHALKGAARGVGAFGIAAMAEAGEAEARKDGALSAETLSDIGIAVEEVRSFISQLLD